MRGASPGTCVAALLLASALAVMSDGSDAKDLGVRGATWPVAESDLLEQIEARLLEMQRTGALARLEAEAREHARLRLEEPEPVPGIARATQRRSRLLNPAVTVARDIRTGDGALVAAAGTRVNPLDRIGLTRDLLFVDGRREAEIAWALAHDRPSKIVLLAGRPLELARRHGRPFFFDQGGRLAARFGLRFTPTSIARAGTGLRIDEIPVEDREDPGTSPGKAPGSVSGAGAKEED